MAHNDSGASRRQRIYEDDPRWNPRTMGNKKTGSAYERLIRRMAQRGVAKRGRNLDREYWRNKERDFRGKPRSRET